MSSGEKKFVGNIPYAKAMAVAVAVFAGTVAKGQNPNRVYFPSEKGKATESVPEQTGQPNQTAKTNNVLTAKESASNVPVSIPSTRRAYFPQELEKAEAASPVMIASQVSVTGAPTTYDRPIAVTATAGNDITAAKNEVAVASNYSRPSTSYSNSAPNNSGATQRQQVQNVQTAKTVQQVQTIQTVQNTKTVQTVQNVQNVQIPTPWANPDVNKSTKGENNGEQERLRILFPFDRSEVLTNYMTNPKVVARLDSILTGKKGAVDSVLVVSKSSPEGPYAYNEALTKRRAASMSAYLAKNYPDATWTVKYNTDAESWTELRQYIVNDKIIDPKTRRDILSVIDSNMDPDEKEHKLNTIPGWYNIRRTYFSLLRFSGFNIFFRPEARRTPLAPLPKVGPYGWLEENTVPVVDNRPFKPTWRPTNIFNYEDVRTYRTIAELKTNLLYDAATVLNFEIEVPIGTRYSVMAEDVFPWWETGNKYCLEMWEIGIEGRYWFRPWEVDSTNKLRGLFAGPYIMSSKYDFQFDKEINYQGEYWSAGATVGYVIPVGRRKRLNMEFSLSAGYLQTDYRHYLPTDTYDKLIRDKYNIGTARYFGPTKAKISLSIPINVPNDWFEKGEEKK